jgi:hypothetical protein
MLEIDFDRPYGVVHGSDKYRYVQEGKYFDGLGQLVSPEAPKREEILIHTDNVDSAAEFLKNILRENPLPKSVVYAEADKNNQPWEHVTTAFKLLGVKKFVAKGVELWKLEQ